MLNHITGVLLLLIIPFSQPVYVIAAVQPDIFATPSATIAQSSQTPEVTQATQSGNQLEEIPLDNLTELNSLNTKLSRTRIKRRSEIASLPKEHFRMNESIPVHILSGDDVTSLTVIDEQKKFVDIQMTKQFVRQEIIVTLHPPQQFEPGTFTLVVSDVNGVLLTQDFTWGVLAMNFNKSVYAPNDTAYIQMAVLDENGTTLCNASLSLIIQTPINTSITLSTEDNSIQKNDDCGHLRPDGSPDYITDYTLEHEGVYQLILTAETANGQYTISDTLAVQTSTPFTIERSGPTRIFPPNTYAMSLTITAQEDFIGTVVETTPESFTISPHPQTINYSTIDITTPYYNPETTTLTLEFPVSDSTANIVRGFGDSIDPSQIKTYEDGGILAHDGIDIAVPYNTPVSTIDDGTVIFAGESVYGTTVIVEHLWGRSYYGNLSAIDVSVNQQVYKRQPIGTSGQALSDTPAHVHIGLKKNTNDHYNGFAGKENPLPYLGKTSLLSDASVKSIYWNLSLAKGESVTIGYSFITPRVSPQFYLLGPLRFFKETSVVSTLKNNLQEISQQLASSSAEIQIINNNADSPIQPSIEPFQSSNSDNESSASAIELDREENTATASPQIQTTPQAQSDSLPPITNELFQSEVPTQQSDSEILTFSEQISPSKTTLPLSLVYEEPRAWQIAADALPNNSRVSSVEFYGGQYSGNGTTGLNSDTNQSFSPFNFQLNETNVSIQQAYIVVEVHFGSYADPPAYTGWSVAFDACQETCTADAWGSGGGQITVSDSSTLAYNEQESMQVRFLADVTTEGTLSTYSGGGTQLEGQIGYRVDLGSAGNSISAAQAKLVLTYTYNADSTEYTNTVAYPLESTNTGDQGTRAAGQTVGCTKNSTCPVFDYTVTLGESSPTQQSQWFLIDFQNDGNNANDVNFDVNIQGTDTDSQTIVHESANGGTQQTALSAYFSGVSGYSADTAQQLEFAHSNSGTLYLIGGEVFHTYTASSTQTSKTKTVRYPMGILNNGTSITKSTASTTVYFPETNVNVEKAWVRYLTSNDISGNFSVDVTTTVGSNSESGAQTYNYNPGGTVPNGAFRIYHVIPSSDYTELESATGTSGITVTASSQHSTTNARGISAELVITYTYDAEYEGYINTATLMAGQDTSTPSQSYTTGTIDPVIPEYTGVLSMRGASLYSTLLLSDSDAAVSAGPITADADLSTGTCSNTNAYELSADSCNAYHYWYEDVTGAMSTSDTQTYTACVSNNGGGDTSGGAKHNSVLIYTYQVTLPTLSQLMRHGKWFDENGTYQAFTF